MCQQFDTKRVNEHAELAIPNGRYVCYRCGHEVNTAATPAQPAPPLDLEAIAARCEAAATGPWLECGAGAGCPCGNVFGNGGEAYLCTMTLVDEADPAYTDSQRVKNAAFIAHARTDIPALLAEVKRLRNQLAEREGE